MRSALNNNQSVRIKSTLSRAYVLTLMRKIREKIVQILLQTNVKDKTDIVVWHDVFNNSICRHKSNNYPPLLVPDLINVMKTLQDKLSALVYCQRDRTLDIFDSLKELEKSNSIQVFSIVKDFISVRKQNNPDLLNQLKALHQSPHIELKNIDFLLRKEGDLSSNTGKTRPSQRARSARKKTSATSSLS